MAEILGQIVGGNIDASWFLTIITGIAGFLLWNQIKEIKHDIHEMVGKIESIVKVLNKNDKRISFLEYKTGIKSQDDDQ